jgi:choline dehydrogenase/4-pyridoxate dehydrogenase
MRYDKLVAAVLRARLFGSGFAADVPVGVTAFLRSEESLSVPDIQFLFLAAPFPTRPYLRPFVSPMPDGFGCRVALLRPTSRGRVFLKSPNCDDHPAIKQNFLSTDVDRRVLRNSIHILRRVAAQDELRPYILDEVEPGADAIEDSDIDAFVRRTGVTCHHPVGTCRMGTASDTMAVVDPALRVRNVEALRVVDASVMPDIVGGNTNAPVIMIAEKAADMILKR